MKTLIKGVLLMLLCLPIVATGQSSEVDFLKKIFSMEKRAIAENFIQLSGSDYNAFWELYDAYEAERGELANKRIDLIKDYADQYNSLTNDQASALVKRSMDLGAKRQKLLKKYFSKISKAVDAKTATSWWQLEQYILTAVNYDLYDNIPFVGE